MPWIHGRIPAEGMALLGKWPEWADDTTEGMWVLVMRLLRQRHRVDACWAFQWNTSSNSGRKDVLLVVSYTHVVGTEGWPSSATPEQWIRARARRSPPGSGSDQRHVRWQSNKIHVKLTYFNDTSEITEAVTLRLNSLQSLLCFPNPKHLKISFAKLMRLCAICSRSQI